METNLSLKLDQFGHEHQMRSSEASENVTVPSWTTLRFSGMWFKSVEDESLSIPSAHSDSGRQCLLKFQGRTAMVGVLSTLAAFPFFHLICGSLPYYLNTRP